MSAPEPDPQSSRAALALIIDWASDGQIIITKHARQRMSERNVRDGDVVHALKTAKECFPEKQGRWRVPSLDLDGDPLTLIATISDGVVIITVT